MVWLTDTLSTAKKLLLAQINALRWNYFKIFHEPVNQYFFHAFSVAFSINNWKRAELPENPHVWTTKVINYLLPSSFPTFCLYLPVLSLIPSTRCVYSNRKFSQNVIPTFVVSLSCRHNLFLESLWSYATFSAKLCIPSWKNYSGFNSVNSISCRNRWPDN